jgi:hypothetical protein
LIARGRFLRNGEGNNPGADGAPDTKEEYMKHLKMVGLLAVAAASLMAFASSASATVITSPAGTEYTGEIHATLATPNSALLKAGIEDTCGESTVKGKVETNTTTASGKISVLTFGDCNRTTKVLKPGSLSIASGGVVTAKENEVTVEELGISCVYGGGTGTKLGTLEGGAGKTAVLNVSTTELPKISGGIFCASKGTWTAKYTVTTPDEIIVD